MKSYFYESVDFIKSILYFKQSCTINDLKNGNITPSLAVLILKFSNSIDLNKSDFFIIKKEPNSISKTNYSLCLNYILFVLGNITMM